MVIEVWSNLVQTWSNSIPSAVLMTAIREFFSTLLEEFGKPGLSFERLREDIEGDTVYLVWKADTQDNRYEFATDTFVLQNGKIVTQTFAGKIVPKRHLDGIRSM
jgi:hypothetical protein